VDGLVLDGLLPVTLGVGGFSSVNGLIDPNGDDSLIDPDGDDGLIDPDGVGGLIDTDGVDGLTDPNGVEGLIGVVGVVSPCFWSFSGVLGLGDAVFAGDTALLSPSSTFGVAGLSADFAGDFMMVRGFISLVLVINSTGFCSACHVPTNDPHGDSLLLGIPYTR